MGEPANWCCPYCNHNVTITDDRRSFSSHRFIHGNKHNNQLFVNYVYICPNPKCREYALYAYLVDSKLNAYGKWEDGEVKKTWQLLPEGNVKPFPDYIPTQILSDYREACLILNLSPKASATLSRRCLQGIIRDFWGVSKHRLKDEIDAIEDKVDAITWGAIDAVRSIGNIGAHMEKDINLIIDVEPKEANLLIGLIENLLKEWYINRQDRKERMEAIKKIAQSKTSQKDKGK